MSVINNTTYFLGPLYTNSIISTGNISIINDVNIDIVKEIINECNLKIKIKKNEKITRTNDGRIV